jgi:CrcB protein
MHGSTIGHHARRGTYDLGGGSAVRIVLIAMAGAAGALARYGIGIAVGSRSFPWATLGINLTGSFLLGFVLAFGFDRSWSDTTLLPISVGFLGAYTTFSTFSYETFTLVRTDRAATALVYVLASLTGGVLAAAAGYATARRLG